MGRSENRILTTHVGSLPGPSDVWGKRNVPKSRLREAVAEVVDKQREVGIDLVNEGELTKPGTWSTFMRRRVSGFEPMSALQPGGITPNGPSASVDRLKFADFYAAAIAKGTLFEQTGTAIHQLEGELPVQVACTSEIRYTGHEDLNLEIELLKASLGDLPTDRGFLTSVAPASFEPGITNLHYGNERDYLFAIADALSVEYEAIAAAGLVVQVDDAFVPALWETIGVRIGLEAYRDYVKIRLEALNHALRNVPRSQARYHLCWGSWHGPHAHDLPLKDIVDLVMDVRVGGYLIESANVRHEHEWRVWETTELPEGTVLMPGVVSHATTLIEHPDLVADRIIRLARVVGPDRVVASTDCGLGARCHPQIAWAKLETLVEGARRASKVLFG